MDGEAALLIDHRVARIRAAMAADNEVRIPREQVDHLALALVAPMPADDRSYRHGPTLPSRRIFIRVRGSAARPPGASRCSARASLRTPSRPHPPLENALRAIASGLRGHPDLFRHRTCARSGVLRDRTTNGVEGRRPVGGYTESSRKGGTPDLDRAKRVLKRGVGA